MSRNVQGSPQGGIQGDIKQIVSPNVFVLLFLTGTFNKSPNMNSSETKKFQDIYWQTSLSVFPSGSNLRNISLQVRKVTNLFLILFQNIITGLTKRMNASSCIIQPSQWALPRVQYFSWFVCLVSCSLGSIAAAPLFEQAPTGHGSDWMPS